MKQGDVIAERYEIQSEIGSGGMATVYVAWDRRLNREVAVKILAAKEKDEEARYLFHREAYASAALSHDAVVRIFDYSGPEECPAYIVMELIDGEALDRLIDPEAPIPEAIIFAIIFRVAKGLAHAHDAGVVHRDVKPENVLLSLGGRVILTDFGLAKAYTEAGRFGQSFDQRATHFRGTAEFLAPEQIKSKKAGPKSDVFALGSTAYTAAAGFSPFIDATPILVMNRIVDTNYEKLEVVRPDLSSELVELVKRLLDADPTARPPAPEVAAQCYRWLCDHGAADVPALLREWLSAVTGRRPKRAPGAADPNAAVDSGRKKKTTTDPAARAQRSGSGEGASAPKKDRAATTEPRARLGISGRGAGDRAPGPPADPEPSSERPEPDAEADRRDRADARPDRGVEPKAQPDAGPDLDAGDRAERPREDRIEVAPPTLAEILEEHRSTLLLVGALLVGAALVATGVFYYLK